eukprot:1247937-Amorphochlora_amoeboformis.AAC.1
MAASRPGVPITTTGFLSFRALHVTIALTKPFFGNESMGEGTLDGEKVGATCRAKDVKRENKRGREGGREGKRDDKIVIADRDN